MTKTATTKRQILGGAVKVIRSLRKIKQDELATAAGVHFAYLSNVENGKRQPSLEVMCKIANALEVDLDAISYLATVYVVTDEDAA